MFGFVRKPIETYNGYRLVKRTVQGWHTDLTPRGEFEVPYLKRIQLIPNMGRNDKHLKVSNRYTKF